MKRLVLFALLALCGCQSFADRAGCDTIDYDLFYSLGTYNGLAQAEQFIPASEMHDYRHFEQMDWKLDAAGKEKRREACKRWPF
jgi:hypothetical protein